MQAHTKSLPALRMVISVGLQHSHHSIKTLYADLLIEVGCLKNIALATVGLTAAFKCNRIGLAYAFRAGEKGFHLLRLCAFD